MPCLFAPSMLKTTRIYTCFVLADISLVRVKCVGQRRVHMSLVKVMRVGQQKERAMPVCGGMLAARQCLQAD